MEKLREKLEELAARKRAELEGALDAEEVKDPFSGGIITSLLISAAVSAASYVVTRAFAPKPPKQEIGKLQGTLQLQNSEQGIMIPEVYGGSPTADKTLGGIKVPAIIVWSSGIRKNVSISQQPSRGGKGGGGGGQGAGTVENISYDTDLGLMFCRGPVNILRLYANADILLDQTAVNPTGLYDPTIGADLPYDPFSPPDPNYNYDIPIDRHNYALAVDGDGVGSGTIQSGAALFTTYPGNEDQTPDPTIEAAVDALYGAGSTPAYKGKSLIVEKTFDLSRWGGIVPNHTAVFEHQTLLTLDDIFASFCERVNVLAANGDYDFTGLSAIACRGMLIAGRLFSPAEVIGSPGIQTVYNYFATETEGQIVGIVEGTEPTVTIADTEIGWLDSDADVSDILPEVDTVIASEIELARQVDIKYLQLGEGDWDPSTQSDNRQITEGESTDLLEVQLALTADEARAAAQRKLYRDYVAGSVHKFTLPWTYLYLYPGYKITITRAEGFSHVLKLTSISGGIGVLECEGIAIEPAAFTQPATGAAGPGYQPPQSIPAMTILTLLDTPLLRDGDETNNSGYGFYMCGTPRTGEDQSWRGFLLYVERTNEWYPIAESNLPGTIGKVVSATVLSDDPTTIDTAGEIVVDLYGDSVLASVTDPQMEDGANRALAGDMVFGFSTATQVPGYPNRWALTDLLNGQRDTEHHVGDNLVGKRFVFINEAVKFVPTRIEDLGLTLDYRAVTVGQSFDDAATVEFAWTGGVLKPRKPSIVELAVDASNDWLIQFEGRPLVSEIPETYIVEVWEDDTRDDPAKLKRSLPVTVGSSHAALLYQLVYTTPSGEVLKISSHTDKNNLLGSAEAVTIESIQNTWTRVDFGIHWSSTEGTAAGAKPVVRLMSDIEITGGVVTGGISEIAVEWVAGTDSGTIKENYRGSYDITGGAPSPLVTRDNVDPGYGGIRIQDGDSPDAGRSGPRYTFMLSGTEYRVYVDYLPGLGQKPLLVVAAPSEGFAFPLTLYMTCTTNYIVRNVTIGGNLFPSTIYSEREQIEDFGSAQDNLNLRIYQRSKISAVGAGIPLDILVHAPALLMEDSTELFTETSDTILR